MLVDPFPPCLKPPVDFIILAVLARSLAVVDGAEVLIAFQLAIAVEGHGFLRFLFTGTNSTRTIFASGSGWYPSCNCAFVGRAQKQSDPSANCHVYANARFVIACPPWLGLLSPTWHTIACDTLPGTPSYKNVDGGA
jgi:hypothetical protein